MQPKRGYMGEIGQFVLEKLVIAVLVSDEKFLEKLIDKLEYTFGTIDYKSDVLNFNYTDYYNLEMGRNIKRIFFSFQKLASPDKFSTIKLQTNEIENFFLLDGKRPVNLDPGLLSVKRFMLATTKDNGHRIPLQKGIYGEVTLLFVNKNFQALPWTYIDYQSNDYFKILKEVRIIYKNNLKELKQKTK
jgi:hypothetical protein